VFGDGGPGVLTCKTGLSFNRVSDETGTALRDTKLGLGIG